MLVHTNRFGTLDLSDDDLIVFSTGLIGFPDETAFVLLRRQPGSPVGWLQSARTPWFALPVVSVDQIEGAYEEIDLFAALEQLGDDFTPSSLAVLVVLHPGTSKPTVNLLAPIVISADTRQGAQILLVGTTHSTQDPFVLKSRGHETLPAPSADTEASTEESVGSHAL